MIQPTIIHNFILYYCNLTDYRLNLQHTRRPRKNGLLEKKTKIHYYYAIKNTIL